MPPAWAEYTGQDHIEFVKKLGGVLADVVKEYGSITKVSVLVRQKPDVDTIEIGLSFGPKLVLISAYQGSAGTLAGTRSVAIDEVVP